MSTASSDKTPSTGKEEGKKPKHAEVFVRIRLEVGVLDPTPEERENSWVLQGLLREEKKASSTISTLWNMPDNVVYVQNLMAWLLDLIESSKNILNWTSPRRTKPIYLAVVAIWAVTLLVPGRLLILLLGMYQFLFAFLPIPEGRSNMIRVGNLLASIANDDDLSRVYEAQRKQCAEAQAQQWQALKLARKVGLVLPVRWCGAVSIKGARSQGGPMPSGFVSVYMLLQVRVQCIDYILEYVHSTHITHTNPLHQHTREGVWCGGGPKKPCRARRPPVSCCWGVRGVLRRCRLWIYGSAGAVGMGWWRYLGRTL
ncbi:hypothetical protein B484DRAFT_293960 [Ochromonadaceae sp. CCMP2298]|nr:hypothetical protein B484DRAFT_293960 [Ochromonadaceae sp. CCMP2298]